MKIALLMKHGLNMEKTVLFLCTFLAMLLCFCAEKQVFFEETFTGVKPRALNGREKNLYRKKRGEVKRFPGPLMLPSGWSPRWDTFEPDSKIVQKKGRPNIISAVPAAIVSPSFSNRFGSYEAELSFSGKGTAELLFFSPAGFSNKKSFSEPAVLETADNTVKKLRIKGTFSGSRFQVMIRCQGVIELKSLVIHETLPPEIRIVEGTVLDRSQLPNVKKFGYPDSNYTLHFRGEQILCGKTCSRELQLVVPGFRNFRNLSSSKLKKGDRIRAVMAPPSCLTEKERRINQADDLTLFHLDLYHVLHVTVIRKFSAGTGSSTPFREIEPEYDSVFGLQLNPPVSQELVQAQKDAIRVQKARMEGLLAWEKEDTALWTEKFQQLWTKECAGDAPKRNRPAPNLVWRKTGNTYWTLPLQFNPMWSSSLTNRWNMAAIIAFRDMLEANGVQLIVQIMPDFYDMAARAVVPEFQNVPDYRSARIVKQFLDAGIETYYTSDLLMENRDLHPFMFLYPTDAHPGSTCQDMVTKQMSEVLARYHFPETLKKDDFQVKTKNLNSGGKWPENCDIGNNISGGPRPVHVITMKGKGVPSDPKSPLLFVGNSFFGTPMGGRTYANYIAWRGLYTSHYTTLAGQGPFTTIFRNIFMNPDFYLKGKKVVVIPVGITSMQNAITWYNVREMDRSRKLLAGKKLKQTLVLKSPLKKETADSLRRRMSNRSRNAWEKSTDRKEFLLTNKKPVAIARIPKDPGKELVCIVPCMLSAGNHVFIHLDGKERKSVPESSSYPCWTNMVIAVPPGRGEAVITMTTENRTAFAALKDLLIYE